MHTHTHTHSRSSTGVGEYFFNTTQSVQITHAIETIVKRLREDVVGGNQQVYTHTVSSCLLTAVRPTRTAILAYTLSCVYSLPLSLSPPSLSLPQVKGLHALISRSTVAPSLPLLPPPTVSPRANLIPLHLPLPPVRSPSFHL